MRHISFQQAAAMDPCENIYTICKTGEDIVILADVQEHPDTGGPGMRVALYGRYGGNWALDKDLVLSPRDSAVGDACGRNAGGITFDYEDEVGWSQYADVYECLFSNEPDAAGCVAVDEPAEIYMLPDGVWHIVLTVPGCYL